MPNYKSYPDDELFALFNTGDHGAYTEIYDRYSGVLFVHAYKRLRNREEAKDLIHELFSVLWSKRGQIELRSSLSSYLYKAVRNRIIDLVARQRLNAIYSGSLSNDWELSADNTDHHTRDAELKRLIELEIDALPEKMRLVFDLSRKKYLSHKQISEELNISEFTVRKQINNALKILRPKLSRFLLFIY